MKLATKPWKSRLWLLLWLFFIILFTYLGFWQLHRYYWKKDLIRRYEQRIQTKPLTLAQLQQPADTLLYHRVQISGEIGPKANVYWQNRYYRDTYGYHVLTPLWIKATQRYLLIDRGFVAQLPAATQKDPLKGMQTVTGIVYYPDRLGFILGADVSSNAAGQMLTQSLNFKALSKALEAPIYPFVLYVQSPIEADKRYSWPLYVQKMSENRRQTETFFGTILPPSRHMGYAVQWFAMALVLTIAVVVSLR
ncbi:MAG: SURF1 family protein [Gammaproteobacteria bacterium]|nr:SURF1 family protein [Gammaproteobacteria bacterium]